MQEKPRSRSEYKSFFSFHERAEALARLHAMQAARPLAPPRRACGETSNSAHDTEAR